MYCSHCEKHFGKEYVVCPECGELLESEAEHQEIVEEEENKRYTDYQRRIGNEIYEPNYEREDKIPEDKSTLYIVLSICSFLCCNMITGVIAFIFALYGKNAYAAHNYNEAVKNWKNAKIALWIGVGLAIVIGVVSFIYGFQQGMADAGL